MYHHGSVCQPRRSVFWRSWRIYLRHNSFGKRILSVIWRAVPANPFGTTKRCWAIDGSRHRPRCGWRGSWLRQLYTVWVCRAATFSATLKDKPVTDNATESDMRPSLNA